VLRRIRLDLGAVERHVPELHQPRLPGQLQHLHEQPGQRREMPPAKLRDGAEVRRVARHDHHAIGALHGRPGDPPRGVDAARVGIEQKRRHHARIERRLPEPARVAGREGREIEALPDQRHDQPRQVGRRHVVRDARRQQLHLVDLPGAKMLAHDPARNQTRGNLGSDYSDRLLGACRTRLIETA